MGDCGEKQQLVREVGCDRNQTVLQRISLSIKGGREMVGCGEKQTGAQGGFKAKDSTEDMLKHHE